MLKIIHNTNKHKDLIVARFFDYFYKKFQEGKKGKLECFVCRKSFSKEEVIINKEVLLPVCLECCNTENEAKRVVEYLDSF